MNISELKLHYEKNKFKIKNRLKEFSSLKNGSKEDIFRELVFCILTAGTSAELGIKTIGHLGNVIFEGSEEEIVSRLKEVYRFYNVRGRFIFLARTNFSEIDFSKEGDELREDIVCKIKGIWYKEASHFLRNIGFRGYAILDKHVVSLMADLGVFDDKNSPKNRSEYMEKEFLMKKFAEDIGIDFDELDLVLWSYKTGKILK